MVDFINGILAYFRALGFISSHGLSRYFLYSGLIGLGIVVVFGTLIYRVAPDISSFIIGIIPWEANLSSTLFDWISIVFSSVLFLSIFKYLMLIFTAPLMSLLSEKVEEELIGHRTGSLKVFNIAKEIIRGLRVNIRNLIRELFITLILLLASFIPVIGIVSGLLIILVQGYFAGFGNHDFWAERHFTFRETIRFMGNNKGMLAGNGVVYIFLLAIPILGAFIAPPLATVAATIDGLKKIDSYV